MISQTLAESSRELIQRLALSDDPNLISLRVLRSREEVEEVRDVWTSWNQHPNSDIDFFLMICGARPEILRPHVIVVSRGGRPECMLIGRVEQTRLNFRFGYSRPFRPEARILTFIHGGVLGKESAENSDILTRVIMRMLHRREIDGANFHHLRVDSPLFHEATRFPGFIWRDHFPIAQPHWQMALPSSFDEYLARLSPKQRHEKRRHMKRLERDFPGKVRVDVHRGAAKCEDLARDVEVVAEKTYQRKWGMGHKDAFETHRIVSFAAQRGSLHACLMYINDKPSAFLIGHSYRNTLYADSMGYDPEYAKYSIGSLLLMRWIEEAQQGGQQQPINKVDFSAGDARYKREICNEEWREASFFMFGPTLKGLKLNALRTISSVSNSYASQLLARTRLLETIKRFWRRMGSRRS